MKINKEVLGVLDHYKISRADALTYLLSLHLGYTASYIPEELKATIARTGIISRDEESKELVWLVPLFGKMEVKKKGAKGPIVFTDTFISAYRELFKHKNPLKVASIKDITVRMKKLFEEEDITENDVYGAAKMYLGQTDRKYIMLPHYFLQKGRGSESTSTIMGWVERYRDHREQGTGSSKSRTIQ